MEKVVLLSELAALAVAMLFGLLAELFSVASPHSSSSSTKKNCTSAEEAPSSSWLLQGSGVLAPVYEVGALDQQMLLVAPCDQARQVQSWASRLGRFFRLWGKALFLLHGHRQPAVLGELLAIDLVYELREVLLE